MSTWTSIIVSALVLIVVGAIYIRFGWRRSPRAYRAMLALAACYFVAGALAGAWVLRFAPQIVAVLEKTEPAKVESEPPQSEPTGLSTEPTPATAADEDTELLRQFCVEHRDASVHVRDFLRENLLARGMLQSAPDYSPPHDPGENGHMHKTTVADVCGDWGREGQPLQGFCIGMEGNRDTESLTPAEFLKLSEPVVKIIRYRAGLDPARPFPGPFNLNPTLADICRDAGF